MDEKQVRAQGERIAVLETSVKSAHRRLDDQARLLESMRTMSVSIKEILTELKHMRADIDLLKSDMETQKSRPGKRWEALVGQVIGLLTAAVIGGLLTRWAL